MVPPPQIWIIFTSALLQDEIARLRDLGPPSAAGETLVRKSHGSSRAQKKTVGARSMLIRSPRISTSKARGTKNSAGLSRLQTSAKTSGTNSLGRRPAAGAEKKKKKKIKKNKLAGPHPAHAHQGPATRTASGLWQDQDHTVYGLSSQERNIGLSWQGSRTDHFPRSPGLFDNQARAGERNGFFGVKSPGRP